MTVVVLLLPLLPPPDWTGDAVVDQVSDDYGQQDNDDAADGADYYGVAELRRC